MSTKKQGIVILITVVMITDILISLYVKHIQPIKRNKK